MAARIDMSNEKENMMYVGQRPWHGLGTELPKAATSIQALEAAGLNWNVEKRQAFSLDKNEKIVKVEDRFAIFRTDTDQPLGIVGPDYHPLQNKDLFSITDALVASKGAHYVTAGSLCEGRRVWGLVKLDLASITVKGEDKAVPYLLAANGHDGWHSIYFALTSVWVVCANTYSKAINAAKLQNQISKLRHTKNVGNKLDEVREALGVIAEPFKELEKQANHLADIQIRKAQLDVFLETMGFNPDATKGAERERYNAMVSAFETAPGQELAARKGTLWGAFNAVTWYVDHGRDFKTPKAKENFIIMGQGDAMKKKAMSTALAMAK